VTTTTIETIDRYPELYTGLELCDGCRRRLATNVVTERDGISIIWRMAVCPVCAETHDPSSLERPTAPAYRPEIRNPRRGLYQVQSETDRSVFYNVLMAGPRPICSCPGRFHANCKHRRAAQSLWEATLMLEAARTAPREVAVEPFDDGWNRSAA
jgi:hypothetical protein